MGSVGEAVTQEGSSLLKLPRGGEQTGQHNHVGYLIWLLAVWQQKYASKRESGLSTEREKMTGISGFGELEDVDTALSARDLSFRFVGVALSLLCGEVSPKSARYADFRTCPLFPV